jgi:hypothetical protein
MAQWIWVLKRKVADSHWCSLLWNLGHVQLWVCDGFVSISTSVRTHVPLVIGYTKVKQYVCMLGVTQTVVVCVIMIQFAQFIWKCGILGPFELLCKHFRQPCRHQILPWELYSVSNFDRDPGEDFCFLLCLIFCFLLDVNLDINFTSIIK